ncbi:sigma-70 family RNA polymerase sigma factor [Maribellus comscasis]|uniref:Sigma-70 family RNA polymerase sigma factor n=1 Tax=Maribellus comscasis TaxID=2681766 RepID=A0A6I6JTM5_9BACT|nr:sigma-70 family RNA polymerase sigma factor [Maribellus comscasis]QGY44589.1 sigma-70 family RNA polymerase sigma factor [Maribellus comscasis]
MNSDSKIWEDFKRGENYALSHIYYQHIQLLFRYGKKFSDDDEIVKDAIQDLFFDLIRTREKLGETDNIKFYLLASFRRKIIKTLKKQTYIIGPPDNKTLNAEIVYSIENEIIDKEELSQKEKAIQEGLKKLTARQREILFYRFSCDLEYEQICEIMSLKYDSARKQVFRALKSLKEVLSDKDIFILFLNLSHRTSK